ncbi:MAG: hypothetical protein HFG41_13245 [Coprococcus sp.]|nr:hypothetical protein [Coprococcus sp.]
MKSKMTSCYDYKQVEIKDELRKWKIPDGEVQAELEALARDHSREEEVEGAIKPGDSVRCICTAASLDGWKDRVILLYPGRGLPGAEEAERQAAGRKKGDEMDTQIGQVKVSLRIENVIRKKVWSVNDDLTAVLNIPGVKTVEDYFQWYHKQKDPGRRQEACNAIVRMWLEAVMANSTFDMDDEEEKEWCSLRARFGYRSLLEGGYDPKKQPDGSVVTEEEAIARMAQEQERYFVPYLIYTYFCEKNGFVITEEDYAEEVKRLAKENELTEEQVREKTDISFYRQVTYQERVFLHILGPEAQNYLED